MSTRNREVSIAAIAVVLFGAKPLVAADLDCRKGKGDVPARNALLNSKIRHVIVLMQENRSWDSYFGMIDLPQCGEEASGQSCVDKLPPEGATNPDPTDLSKTIPSFHQTLYCTEDTAHGWDSSHVEYNRVDPNAPVGFNDGFTNANVSAADPTGHRSMGYYDGTDIDYYWDLVRLFAFGDRYFSTSLDSTYPNREYLLAASSFGHIKNDFPAIPSGFPVDSIFTRLDAAGITWKNYFLNLPQAGLVYDSPNTHLAPLPVFFADLATCLLPAPLCQLPQVSFVDPAFLLVGLTGLESTDEHPQNDVQEGQAFVAAIVDAPNREPGLESVRALPDVRRSRRLLRSRRAAARLRAGRFRARSLRGQPGRHLHEPRHGELERPRADHRRLRSLRIPRAERRHLTLGEARLRLARGP
jgi:hypothetical protein